MSNTSSSSTAATNANVISTFNSMSSDQLQNDLLEQCHSISWVEKVISKRPYSNMQDLITQATFIWYDLGETAWKEAFAGHGSLGVKTAEQTEAVASSKKETIASIQHANEAYEQKHGHKCITFAAGKTTERLLQEVVSRTPLTVEEEMRRCAEQTMLITSLRLTKYVHCQSNSDRPTLKEIQTVSPLTTHILDTSLGVPAKGVNIQMEHRVEMGSGGEYKWIPVATGETNSDGRVTDMLPGFYDTCGYFQKGTITIVDDIVCMNSLSNPFFSISFQGVYRLTFDTDGYYKRLGSECFYPNVVISFYVNDPKQHYHVPLLLNPYGYSTYRGS
jgi:5-hydroxyisourate hydrolase/2-oxo-4-hydroxy-4-carboxy-5-ureidoimidazoline decarboxylase